AVSEARCAPPTFDFTYVPEGGPEITTSFAVSSAVVTSLNLAATGMSSELLPSGGRGPWLARAGLVVGVAGVILGANNVGAGGPRRALATLDIAAGATAILSSSWALIKARHPADDAAQAHDPGVSFRPSARWGRTSGPTLGLAVKF
ncbi:MAG TPA: hypothetical protein VIE39_06460, partial [Thermoanaerobaculia bacterium]